MARIRSKAAVVAIIYLTLFIFFWIVFRGDHTTGRLYDAKGRTCLGVTDQLAITRHNNDECENNEAQWALQTDGDVSTVVYYAPEEPLCVTNDGDGSVSLLPCTGAPNQAWTYRDSRLISTFTTAAEGPGEEQCLTSWNGFLHGGDPVGLRRCSKGPTQSQTWKFAADDSVFSF